jgi:hypothetical protein
MKIANIKIVNLKGMVAKVLTVGVLAGAVAMVAPTKAQAQEVFVGVGRPYARHNFYERERIEAARRHEFERREFIRHEEFRRDHERFYRGYR